MKKILSIFFLLVSFRVHAQNFEEWTQQKKTQIKYLVAQIAAFQVYTEYARKGYTIAKEGLSAIHNIKKGDFSLHEAYFGSLKSVNPRIKSYWKVAGIIALQIRIVECYHRQRNRALQSGQFTTDEMSYCNKVFTNLLDGCTAIIDQLIMLTTNDSAQLKDDERIKRIDDLHKEMKEKYVFVQHFTSEANVLAMQRLMDAGDIRTVHDLYGIH